MIGLIENIGEKSISYFEIVIKFLLFLLKVLWIISNIKNYNTQMRLNIVLQLYASCVKPLFIVLFLALFMGSIIYSLVIFFAIGYGLQENIGNFLISFTVNEFSPLFIASFLVFYYGFDIYGKIIDIKQQQENITKEIYISKIIGGLVAVPSLSLLFALVMLISGYIVSYFYLDIDIETYQFLVTNSMEIENLFIIILKSLVLGLVSTTLPVYYTMNAEIKISKKPQQVISVLGVVFFSFLFIELISLILVY